MARASGEQCDLVEKPSAAELAVFGCLVTGLSRREIGAHLYISLNSVKTHSRELCRKLDVTSRADAVVRAEAACSILPNHPGDPLPTRPKPRPSCVMVVRMSPSRYRLVVEGELGPRYASAFEGMKFARP